VIKMNKKTILIISAIIVVLAVVIFGMIRKPNFQNDPQNCGALGNQCELGFRCIRAFCVR
jgi:hypothetical protein